MEQLHKFLDNIQNSTLAPKLNAFLSSSPPEKLFHIDVYALADSWSIPRKELLEVFFTGVDKGIFVLAWEFHCPFCGGVPRESIRLQETQNEDHCSSCNIDFKNQLDKNIEVFFSIDDSIVQIPPEIKSKYMERIMHDITMTKKFDWQKDTTIRGIDCINNSFFRRTFENNTLPLDQSLEIKQATVLFTDIKGSTSMYETLGDSKAYLLVREHFNILFQAIEDGNGVPVKTIGDAVMGVFSSDSDALQSAITAQNELTSFYRNKSAEERIQVKIGLHSGSVIVVTLNGRLDYFGTTVNMAARIQGLSRPGQILISDSIFNSGENKKIILKHTNRVMKRNVQLKGLTGDHPLYGINILEPET